MGNTIPVNIKLKCENCSYIMKELKWFPDDSWKELAEVEQRRCPVCNEGIMKTVFYEEAKISLVKKKNTIYLKVGDFISPIISLSERDNKEIILHLYDLLTMPFYGKILFQDAHNYEREIVFSRDGIVVEERY